MTEFDLSDPYLLREYLRTLTDQEFATLLSTVNSEAVYRATKAFGK